MSKTHKIYDEDPKYTKCGLWLDSIASVPPKATSKTNDVNCLRCLGKGNMGGKKKGTTADILIEKALTRPKKYRLKSKVVTRTKKIPSKLLAKCAKVAKANIAKIKKAKVKVDLSPEKRRCQHARCFYRWNRSDCV